MLRHLAARAATNAAKALPHANKMNHFRISTVETQSSNPLRAQLESGRDNAVFDGKSGGRGEGKRDWKRDDYRWQTTKKSLMPILGAAAATVMITSYQIGCDASTPDYNEEGRTEMVQKHWDAEKERYKVRVEELLNLYERAKYSGLKEEAEKIKAECDRTDLICTQLEIAFQNPDTVNQLQGMKNSGVLADGESVDLAEKFKVPTGCTDVGIDFKNGVIAFNNGKGDVTELKLYVCPKGGIEFEGKQYQEGQWLPCSHSETRPITETEKVMNRARSTFASVAYRTAARSTESVVYVLLDSIEASLKNREGTKENLKQAFKTMGLIVINSATEEAKELSSQYAKNYLLSIRLVGEVMNHPQVQKACMIGEYISNTYMHFNTVRQVVGIVRASKTWTELGQDSAETALPIISGKVAALCLLKFTTLAGLPLIATTAAGTWVLVKGVHYCYPKISRRYISKDDLEKQTRALSQQQGQFENDFLVTLENARQRGHGFKNSKPLISTKSIELQQHCP